MTGQDRAHVLDADRPLHHGLDEIAQWREDPDHACGGQPVGQADRLPGRKGDQDRSRYRTHDQPAEEALHRLLGRHLGRQLPATERAPDEIGTDVVERDDEDHEHDEGDRPRAPGDRDGKSEHAHPGHAQDRHRSVIDRVASRGERIEENRQDRHECGPTTHRGYPAVVGTDADQNHTDDPEESHGAEAPGPHVGVELAHGDDHQDDHKAGEPPSAEQQAPQEDAENHHGGGNPHGQIG